MSELERLGEEIDAILQAAVPEDDYPKGAHRFFQRSDPYGSRQRAIAAILALPALNPPAEREP